MDIAGFEYEIKLYVDLLMSHGISREYSEKIIGMIIQSTLDVVKKELMELGILNAK